MREWQPIETCPEGVEVETKIDDANGVRNEQNLIKRTRVPGQTAPLFWTADNSMYVYYVPTHWRHKAPVDKMDKRPLFMVAPSENGDPSLFFFVPETAYNPVSSGHAFDFDLSGIGIPFRVFIVKSKDHADGMAQVEALGRELNIPVRDHRREDFSTKDPKA